MNVYTFAISDETFEEVRESFDTMLQNTVDRMFKLKNPEGEVNLKLKIKFESTKVLDPATGEAREALVPVFGHKVTNLIQDKNAIDGQISYEREIVYDESTGGYGMRDLYGEQMEF